MVSKKKKAAPQGNAKWTAAEEASLIKHIQDHDGNIRKAGGFKGIAAMINDKYHGGDAYRKTGACGHKWRDFKASKL